MHDHQQHTDLTADELAGCLIPAEEMAYQAPTNPSAYREAQDDEYVVTVATESGANVTLAVKSLDEAQSVGPIIQVFAEPRPRLAPVIRLEPRRRPARRVRTRGRERRARRVARSASRGGDSGDGSGSSEGDGDSAPPPGASVTPVRALRPSPGLSVTRHHNPTRTPGSRRSRARLTYAVLTAAERGEGT